ncbi:multidrug effflux MFS transporter [Pseudomonas sp. 13B_2.1_Bac1]|uniref:multidrug effflux MFS transporter n=1 Tax=Pseudomonas sp. 13B_2.1_Bac1 TaxID=2971624 RepID=UPI0021C696F1|nr:multidrug effflux MFS transporter [Pseudomonas sp. 13B_2.1_Bac1]MCU1787227.1 multidrug effflux MFS transporter [Pseudomonas sp. 13B_2.1_Bac1]
MNLRIILILGALSAFAPLAIDFYLPGFPAMATAFATDEKHIQLTLAVYFGGLAIGQLIYGPLADRFGRRGPLLSGVTLFTLASFACAFAPSLEWLIGARFVQALGGCAGMVISRAVVSDKCDAVGSAKVFSQLMLVTGLAPILAPLAGGLMVGLWGWQSIFLALSIFSVMAAVAVAVGLPETFPAHQPRQPLSGSLRRYGSLLSDRVYLGYALTGGISIAGMFAYIAGSPFVSIKLYGVPAEHYGWVFGSNAAGFILMAQVNARLLAKRGPAFLLSRTVWLYMLAALTLLGIAALRTDALWPLLVPLFICIASLGCILPNTSACAMAGQGARAGSASALLGCIQFGVAAGAASLVGVLHDGTAMPMAMVISLCGVLAVTIAMSTQRLQRARALQAQA